MGQCACLNTQQPKQIPNAHSPRIKEATVTSTNTVKYTNVTLQRRLVHIYCLNIYEDNIPLDVIQVIMLYYSTNVNMGSTYQKILITHQKVDSFHYTFNHQIIGSQQPQNMYKQRSNLNECETIQHKILLLGTSNSGKSTIFKQLRYIYDGVDQEELQNNKQCLSKNIIRTIETLAEYSGLFSDSGIVSMWHPNIADAAVESQNRVIRDRIAKMRSKQALTSQDYDVLIKLLNDIGIQRPLPHRHSKVFTIEPVDLGYCLDSYKLVFPSMKYYKRKDYVQTIDDFLWTYKRSDTFLNTSKWFSLQYNTTLYEIYDVPGGKPYRRNWMPLLNNVSITMFVINLDGYYRSNYNNQCLETTEAINLLGDLLRYTQMTKCLILIFNKIDLLEESIMHIDFKKRFSDFEGDTHNKVEIINFILRKCFDEIARGKDKRPPNVTQIHCFVANALNTECIKNVFDYIHLHITDSL
eukprot:958865_1